MKTFFSTTTVVVLCTIFTLFFNQTNAAVIIQPVDSGISITNMYEGDGDQAIAFFSVEITAWDSDVYVSQVYTNVTSTSPSNILGQYVIYTGADYDSANDIYVIREGVTIRTDVGFAFDVVEDGFASVQLANIIIKNDLFGVSQEVYLGYETPAIFLKGTSVPEPGVHILFVGCLWLLLTRRKKK